MSPDKSVSPLLTDGQRRHLVASLASVAAALHQVESLARPGSATTDGSLGRVVYDLPANCAETIEPPLTRALEAIAELSATLHLEAPSRSASRSVQALLVSSLVTLEDSEIPKLRAYGEIHPRLPDLLEPALRRIHDHVRALGDVVAASREVPCTGSKGNAP